ncbi:MAG: hypothetical protein R3E13_03685 [Alphaproteobacteria bacterium]
MATLAKNIIQKRLKRLAAFAAIASVGFCLAATALHAQPFAPSSCDPQYYESLEARAWLESQREITQNQNLILKPDSVLEYTCFDSLLGELVKDAGAPTGPDKLFTATDRWSTPPAGNIAASLTNLVGKTLAAYDAADFDHDLLGGRGGVPYVLSGTISSGSYACNTMNEVWKVAKCMDFIDQPAHDGFFTFVEYANDPDKRALPSTCPNKGPYEAAIKLAVVNASTHWHEDDLHTYFDYIYPPSGGNACGGSAGGPNHSMIETGLIVESTTEENSGVTRYAETICVVPGCYFVPTADYPSTPSGGSSSTVPSGGFDHNVDQAGKCCPFGSTSCP